MCDPFSIISMIGAGIKGIASSSAHQQQAELAEANARMLAIQAEIAEEKGMLALVRGAYDQVLVRRKGGQVMAQQTAAAAGGNVDPSFGTPMLLQGFSAAQVEVDAGLIHAAALGERADALSAAANLQARSASEVWRARAERTASTLDLITLPFNVGTQFLSGQRVWSSLGQNFAGGGSMSFNPFGIN